uniref:Uncharacterized protein n=1 Tax=Oryza punctata TaxID=4537 RepID=A0A0E0L3E4_ORYPU
FLKARLLLPQHTTEAAARRFTIAGSRAGGRARSLALPRVSGHPLLRRQFRASPIRPSPLPPIWAAAAAFAAGVDEAV